MRKHKADGGGINLMLTTSSRRGHSCLVELVSEEVEDLHRDSDRSR